MQRHVVEEAVFAAAHAAPCGGGIIVVALQVEQAVDEVAGQLGLPGGVEAWRLGHRLRHADVDLSVNALLERRSVTQGRAEWHAGSGGPIGRLLGERLAAGGAGDGWARVVEGDHVGATGVAEEGLVEPGDLAGPDQLDAECGSGPPAEAVHQQVDEAAEGPGFDRPRALAVAQDDRVHFARPRCSS
jgi:hypothetical protein